jgi:hypothetical protein
MKLHRLAITPASFEAVSRGDQTAMVVNDEGVSTGDEYALTRELSGEYRGPGGLVLVTVTHVDRDTSRLVEGFAVVSVKRPGRR